MSGARPRENQGEPDDSDSRASFASSNAIPPGPSEPRAFRAQERDQDGQAGARCAEWTTMLAPRIAPTSSRRRPSSTNDLSRY